MTTSSQQLIDFNILLEKIIKATLSVAELIKDIRSDDDNSTNDFETTDKAKRDSLDFVEKINYIYKDRSELVEFLQKVFNDSDSKLELTDNNPL